MQCAQSTHIIYAVLLSSIKCIIFSNYFHCLIFSASNSNIFLKLKHIFNDKYTVFYILYIFMQIMECAQTTHIQYAVSALFCNNIFLIISGNKNITFNWVFFKLYTVFLKSKILSVYWKVLIWVYFQPFIVKIYLK